MAPSDDGTPTEEAMMQVGMLPESLPPIFTSKQLRDSYPQDASYLVTVKVEGALSPYSASKRGGNRRLFNLPHPTFVRDQALFLEKHWSALKQSMEEATGSLSKPQFVTGPRSVRITPHSALPKHRLRAFSRFKLCVVTDVARFYPSIYTHSIAWAINGREAAKKDRRKYSATVFGNRLDFLFRQAQSQQTSGIPVGPDTSRITAELVLCAVDRIFMSRAPGAAYLRHVDDYWIGGNSHDDCERHLQNLRAALREFELDLNELKTRMSAHQQSVWRLLAYRARARHKAELGELERVRLSTKAFGLM